MAFIPNEKIIRVGDRIRITQPIKMWQGTFTVGHEFTVVGSGARGFDLRDDDGNKVGECGMIQHTFRKVC